MKKRVLMVTSLLMLLLLLMAVPAMANAGEPERTQSAASSSYTVEFTYEGDQYVMTGDSSVRLSAILDKVGLTGEVEAVEISDTSLFSASNETGEWIVTAHRAFSSTEWMKVTIGGAVHEITVTDTNEEQTITYTLDCKSENQRYIYSLVGSDGSSSVVYDVKYAQPTRITVDMGEDVTVDVYSGGDPFYCSYSDRIANICGFTNYFITADYTFTFTSKTHNISHIQIDAFGYNGGVIVKTSKEAEGNGKTLAVNWAGGSGLTRMGAPGKFIVTFAPPVQTYNISYVLNGGTNSSSNPATYDDNKAVTLADPTRTGYTFEGWYDNAGLSGSPVTGIPKNSSGDKTLYAKWKQIPAVAPTITKNPVDINLIANNITGNVLSVTATAASGHTLSYQWYSNTRAWNTGGTAISGATTASYTIPANTAVGTYYYYCVLTAARTDNGATAAAVSNVATVTIKNQQTLSFASDAQTKTYGDADFTISATHGAGNGAVSYAVTSGYAASVNSITGAVHILKAGKATITATAAETGTYVQATAQYTLTVKPKSVTITGLTVSNKVYDGTATADVTGTPVVSGKIETDNVAVTAGTAAFSDANVGNGKTVTFSGYRLSGMAKYNYALSAQPANVEANITARSVTVSGITASNKTYDGTTDAEFVTTGATFDGICAGDALTVTATGAFEDANAETGKTVTISGLTLGGADAGNYVLAENGQQTSTTADITQKSITGATVTLNTTQLEYSGTEQSVSVTSVTLDDTVLTTDDYDVSGNSGTDKNTYTVTVTGKGNYTGTATATWKITKAKAIVMTAPTANTLTYNGNEQELVTGGAADTSIEYALGTDADTALVDGYIATIPSAADAKTYYVWYRAAADANHDTSDPAVLTVKIAKANQTITADNMTATYGDTDKSVSASVTVPATGGGAISYAVKNGSGDYIGVDASTGALTIKKAGTATVIVTAAETANYAQATKEVTVTIAKARISPTLVIQNKTYDGNEITYTIEDNPGRGAVTNISWEKEDSDNSWNSVSDTPKDAGTYRGTATIAETDNYNGATTNRAEFTINAVVAKIGETGYTTLKAALDAAKDGETIVVQKDINEPTANNSSDYYKDIIIDLNNHSVNYGKINIQNSLTLKNGKYNGSISNANTNGDKQLTIDDADVSLASSQWLAKNIHITNNGKLTMNTSAGLGGGGEDGFNLTIGPDCEMTLSEVNYSDDTVHAYNAERVVSQMSPYLPGGYSAKKDVETVRFYNSKDEEVHTISLRNYPSYEVRVTKSGSGTATAAPTSAKQGSEIGLTVAPGSGFELNSVVATYPGQDDEPKNVELVQDTSDSTEYTFTMPAGNVTVNVVFAQTYSITYDLKGGALSAGATNPTSYTALSEAITLNNPSKDHYTFAGWTGTGLSEAAKDVVIEKGSTGKREYTAAWTPLAYDIRYELNGGVNAVGNPASYTIESDDITLGEPTKTGYTFSGWTYEGQTSPQKTVTIREGSWGSKSYTANWTPIPATAPTIASVTGAQLTYGYTSGSVSVSAAAASDAEYTLSYQWYKETDGDGEAQTGEGAKESSYRIPAGKPAGTSESYYCVVTATRKDNGTSASATSGLASVKVGAATMDVEASGYDGVYDRDPHSISITVASPDGAKIKYRTAEIGAYNLTENPGYANVGSYTVYYEVSKENYTTVTGSAVIAISPRTVSAPTVTLSPNAFTYDGQEKRPAVIVKDGNVVIPSAEYETSYSNNINAGVATVTITDKDGGNYTVSGTKTFTIGKKPITPTIAVTGEYTFNGREITPSYTVKDGDTQLAKTDYTAAISDNVDAGQGKITVTASESGNYAFAQTEQTFNIRKGEARTIANIPQSLTYTASSISASVAGKMPDNAGTLTYRKGTAEKTGGVSVSEFEVDDTGDVTASISGSAAGDTITLPVVISSTNYEDSIVKVIITLTEKEDAGVIIWDGTKQITSIEKTYGDAPFTLTGAVQNSGTGGTWTWSSSDTNVADVSNDGTVTIKAAANMPVTITAVYDSDTTTGTASVSLTVRRKQVTIAGLTAADKEYDGKADATPSGTPVIRGTLEDDSVSVSTGTASFDNKNVGDNKTVTFSGYSLSGAKAKNYALTSQPAAVKANIAPRPVSVTGITAPGRTYRAKDRSVELSFSGATVNGVVAGEVVSIDHAEAAGTMADANAGNDKPVTVSGVKLSGKDAVNYVLAVQPADVKVTISKASGSISYSQENVTRTYGDEAFTNTLTKTGDGTLTYASDKEAVATVDDAGKVTIAGAGEATITATVEDGTNYSFATKSASYKLTVNKAAMTVYASGYTGAYDGNSHGVSVQVTKPTSGSRIKFGTAEGSYDLDACPRIVNVDDSKTVYFKITAPNYSDYTSSAAVEISKAESNPATVTADNRTYDGAEKPLATVTGNVTGGEMRYALGADAATPPATGWGAAVPEATDAGTYHVWYRVEGDANHDDSEPACVTANIARKELTIAAKSAAKAFDGRPLTEGGYESGALAAGDTLASVEVRGSQRYPGSSENVASGAAITRSGRPATANYRISYVDGTLTVTDRTDGGADRRYEIAVRAKSATATYDGAEHTVSGFEDLRFSLNGVEYTVSGLAASASLMDAGSVDVTAAGTAVVKDADGVDVTSQFDVEVADGRLTVGRRKVTLTSATDTKEYDGAALTNDTVTVGGDGFVAGQGADFEVTGSQRAVGASPNSFTYTLREGTKADDYDITTVEGTLTVTSRDAKYEISPRAQSATVTYDGQAHTVSGLVTDTFTIGGETYTVSGLEASATATDAGTHAVSVAGTAVVTDAGGRDVSSEFSVVPQGGTLTISQRRLTLTSARGVKEYDGDPLTAGDVEAGGDGFAGGEGASYTVTGSQTLPGESENTFTYSLSEDTKEDNYVIAKVYGKLTVRDRSERYAVTLTANSGAWTYDGREKTVEGYAVAGSEGPEFVAPNGKAYTMGGVSASASAARAGAYPVIVGGTPQIIDASGNDVTGQFEVTTERGSLRISRRQVTLTSATDAKEYDGAALTNATVTVGGDGFAGGEGATFAVTGSQTLAGSSENAFTYSLDAGTDAGNYDITCTYGTLTVTMAKAVVKVAPTATDAAYSGHPQELVGAGVAEGGEMRYALGQDATTAPESGWGAPVPTATDAGTYFVWYKAAGDENHDDTSPACVTATVGRAEPVAVAPAATATFGQTLADVLLANPAGNTDGAWDWADRSQSVGNVGLNVRKANFTPMDALNYKGLGGVDVTVDVRRADNPATVAQTATVRRGGATLNLRDLVSPNGATGDVSFEIAGDACGCVLQGALLSSGDEVGTVTVVAAVAEDASYNALGPTPIAVSVTDKDAQTILAEAVSVTYGDASARVYATTTGDGAISYSVRDTSLGYIDVDAATGALTVLRVPADGRAYVSVYAAETQQYAWATKDVLVTIGKAAASPAVVVANDHVYDGTERPLVRVAGEPVGGEMRYALGADAAMVTAGNLYVAAEPARSLFGASVPTATDAGTYEVWYMVEGDENHADSDPACVTVTVDRAEPTAAAPVATATAGQTLADVALENPAGNTEGAWSWADPSAGVGEAGRRAFRANFAPADARNYLPVVGVEVTVTVAANTAVPASVSAAGRTYDGTERPLAQVVGEPVGGEMRFALGQDATTAPEFGWGASVPTATDAGTYFVWYRAEGDGGHTDSDPACVTVVVGRAEPTIARAPVATATAGQTLADVALENPAGNTEGTWSWADPSAGVGEAGQRAFRANFAPADAKNYLPVVGVEVTVTVDANRAVPAGRGDRPFADAVTGLRPSPQASFGRLVGYESLGYVPSSQAAAVTRIQGPTRYQTMSAVASAAFASSGHVILASGERFADALSSSALAGALRCPVVLTAPGALSAEASSAIRRLGATSAVVVGGPAALAEAVERDARSLAGDARRVAGADRVATSVEAMRATRAIDRSSRTVVVASGQSFADALSAGAWSYATASPIVLTAPDGRLTDEAALAIASDGGFGRVVIVGGPAAVSDDVRAQLGGS